MAAVSFQIRFEARVVLRCECGVERGFHTYAGVPCAFGVRCKHCRRVLLSRRGGREAAMEAAIMAGADVADVLAQLFGLRESRVTEFGSPTDGAVLTTAVL